MSKPIKLPSGNWRVQWLDAAGKRKSATFCTEAAAKSGLRRKEVEVDDIRSGRAREKSEMTVAEAAEAWLPTRPPKARSDDDSHLRNHILPFMSDKKLPEVSTLIETFIRHLEHKRTARPGEKNAEGRTLGKATIGLTLATLRKMMNDMGYPTRIKYRVPTGTYAWLKTPAVVAKYLDECDPPWFRMASELAVYAGLRKGEIAGLVGDSIDYDRGMVEVSKSYDGPPKGGKTRFVPLAPELALALRRWRMGQGGSGDSPIIRVDGAPITKKTEMARRTQRACRRAKIPPVKFHELRDTYASHLAERVSLPIVAAVLGHKDVKTTQRYAHIDTESLARDPRLHLTFQTGSGKVRALPEAEPECTRGAHESETQRKTSGK